jgi:SAM-dependent methyltransferase
MPLVNSSETHSPSLNIDGLKRLGTRIANAFVAPLPSSQGVHIDPLAKDEPNPNLWSEVQRAAWFSEEMRLFRECLQYGGMDVRSSVLDDLSQYYGLPPEECLQRCLHWEEWSVSEWHAGNRSTHDGLRDFYNSVQSWSFDLLWYAYLQATGFGFPSSVIIARFAQKKCPGGRHLDFGSGVGVTSQLFARLGFDTTCADVSKTLLDFAQWRIARRGDRAGILDLNQGELAKDQYDVVTAVDTLTHVPDFDATVHTLHRAIRPGGWLFTNFDVRKKGTEGSAWHLYEDALDLEFRLRRIGFARRAKLGGAILCYERTDPSSTLHQVRTLRDRVTLQPPIGTLVAANERIKWPTPERIRRLAYKVTRNRSPVR